MRIPKLAIVVLSSLPTILKKRNVYLVQKTHLLLLMEYALAVEPNSTLTIPQKLVYPAQVENNTIQNQRHANALKFILISTIKNVLGANFHLSTMPTAILASIVKKIFSSTLNLKNARVVRHKLLCLMELPAPNVLNLNSGI